MSETKWYHRQGGEVDVTNKALVIGKGGSASYQEEYACMRCGGHGGSDHWRHTGVVCYRCGGATRRNAQGLHLDPSSPSKNQVYTAEKLAKLNAAADAKYAKVLAKAEAHEAMSRELFGWIIDLVDAFVPHCWASHAGFMNDVKESIIKRQTLSDKQECAILGICEKTTKRLIAEAAKSNAWVGEIGERIERRLTCKSLVDLGKGEWGRTFILILEDEAGNSYKYMGGSAIEKGLTFDIKFTVKKHDDYKGTKQTVIARMAVNYDTKEVTA